MSSVYEEGVECPVCRGNTAHSDLDIHTNEREWNCERCGFYSETKIVELAGKKFWQHTMQMPMSEDGKVAWPEMQAVEGGKWNRNEFSVMPNFGKIPEGFGVEEAKD